MKINLKENIARLVFTFEGVEYNLTQAGRIVEDPTDAFVAFVESTPELVIEYDDFEAESTMEDGSKKKSKKSKE